MANILQVVCQWLPPSSKFTHVRHLGASKAGHTAFNVAIVGDYPLNPAARDMHTNNYLRG